MKGVNAREISEILYKVFFFLENQKLLNSYTSISKKKRFKGVPSFPSPSPVIQFFFFFALVPAF